MEGVTIEGILREELAALLATVRAEVRTLPDYDDSDWNDRPDDLRCDIDLAKAQLERAIQRAAEGLALASKP